MPHQRFIAYPRILVAAYVIGLAFVYFGPMGDNISFFSDYATFQVAADMIAAGQITEIYDKNVVADLQRLTANRDLFTPFYYPPTFLFAISWSAPFNYEIASPVFTLVTLSVLVLAAKPMLIDRHDIWILLGAPAGFIVFTNGQNSFLTAALTLVALRYLRSSAVLAGLALGALTIKPQLGVLFPFLVIAWRRWTVFATTVLATACLVVLSLVLHGPEVWQAFLTDGIKGAGNDAVSAYLPVRAYGSPFGALLFLGVDTRVAVAIQFLTIIGLGALLAVLVQRGARESFVTAVFLCSIVIAAPHALPYDWIFSTLGLLLVWCEGRRTGFKHYELGLLVFGYFAPIMVSIFGILNVPHGFFLALIPFSIALRRALGDIRDGAGQASSSASQ